jgi:hypothetical protein
MSTITASMLEHACKEQRDLFRDLFGESVEVTEDLCGEHADKFDWDWAASRLLLEDGRARYKRARALIRDQYLNATGPAFKAYMVAHAIAWQAFVEAPDKDCGAYRSAIAEAHDVRARGVAAHEEEQNRQCASEFAKLFIAQCAKLDHQL